MATLTFTVPDAQVPRVLTALGYDPAQGVTQAEFVRRWLIRHLVQTVSVYEAQAAAAALPAPDPIGVT